MQSLKEKVTELLEARGEGLLDDVGVDPEVAKEIAEDIMFMLPKNIVVVIDSMGLITGLFGSAGEALGEPEIVDYSKIYNCPCCDEPFTKEKNMCTSCGYDYANSNLEKILQIREQDGVWGSGV